MTNPTANSGGDAVARLVAERERYEAWLAALEARRASTPAHIYDRVRADYETRLRNVAAQLGEHRASVQAMADSVLQRLSALDADERQRRDDMMEAELRASIGELDQEQYRAQARRGEEALAAISGERTKLGSELSRLNDILKFSGGTPVIEPPREEAPRPQLADAPIPRPAAQREARNEPPAAPAATQVASATAAPLADQPPRRGDRAADAFDELEFLKSVVDSRLRGSTPEGAGASVGGAPAGASLASPPPAAAREAGGASAAPAGARSPAGSGAVPAFLRDVPAEQTKTLKCQECGAMNYPTEWYCERCGAELAAL